MNRRRRRMRAWIREWKRRVRDGWHIMGPILGPILLVTQVPVLFLELLICELLHRRLGSFPKTLEASEAPADVLIAVGLGSTPYSAYCMGQYLRWRFNFRIIFLQTPIQGNLISSSATVKLNREWLTRAVSDRPLYAIGFSYGGLDLVWQLHQLLQDLPETPVRSLYTVNTPFKGSALARVVHVTSAREMDPGAEHLGHTHAVIHALRKQGVRVRYNTAFLDLVVRKSDSREPRHKDAYVPNRWQRYLIWPLLHLLGLHHKVPHLPKWWSHTLPHIAHKATLNPLVWEVLGQKIRRDLHSEPMA